MTNWVAEGGPVPELARFEAEVAGEFWLILESLGELADGLPAGDELDRYFERRCGVGFNQRPWEWPGGDPEFFGFGDDL